MKMNLQLFAGEWTRVTIYSNDGLTILYQDDLNTSRRLIVNSSGCSYDGVQVYTYSGSGTFIGFSTSPNSSNAVYAIDDEISFYPAECDFYIVEQSAPTYKHLTLYDGTKIQVESAIRDEDGNKLETVYALKTDLNNITATDISITEDDEEAQLSPADPRE